MENPPFEDVSPIKKMVSFHCYVSLPEGNCFLWVHLVPSSAHQLQRLPRCKVASGSGGVEKANEQQTGPGWWKCTHATYFGVS